MLTSPHAILFESIIQRIQAKVPDVKFIDQELGQLEDYEIRPAVSWPCVLVDLEEFKFSDSAGDMIQVAEGVISLRLGLVQYSNSNNLSPAAVRANALRYYEIEQKLYIALHGWDAVGFGRMLRRAVATERRDDNIRVRVLKYSLSYTDDSAMPARTKVPRPNAGLFR